jgi:transcriptional regulator with XRE-family HTH domain
MVHDLRTEAGLTQKELADLVGTTQSVISRLEDADYEGHSLFMLRRIATALKQRLLVLMTAEDREPEALRFVFQEVIRSLRKQQRLTVDQLAKRLEIDRAELVAMERIPGYRPSPLTLHKLAQFYDIPERRFAELAGTKRASSVIREKAARYAARSESFAKLTPQERRCLEEFVNVLKGKGQ